MAAECTLTETAMDTAVPEQFGNGAGVDLMSLGGNNLDMFACMSASWQC